MRVVDSHDQLVCHVTRMPLAKAMAQLVDQGRKRQRPLIDLERALTKDKEQKNRIAAVHAREKEIERQKKKEAKEKEAQRKKAEATAKAKKRTEANNQAAKAYRLRVKNGQVVRRCKRRRRVQPSSSSSSS